MSHAVGKYKYTYKSSKEIHQSWSEVHGGRKIAQNAKERDSAIFLPDTAIHPDD